MSPSPENAESSIAGALQARQLPTEFTILLGRASKGDQGAKDEVFSCSYSRLRAIAGNLARSLPIGNELEATALVSEAFLRLEQAGFSAANRRHFLGLAATSMRSALADDYRRRTRVKRQPGEGKRVVPLRDELTRQAERAFDPIELNEAMQRLQEHDASLVEVVHLRFFLCMTVVESAEVLGVSASTVERRFREAREWLRAELI